jgi:hypothetical protein
MTGPDATPPLANVNIDVVSVDKTTGTRRCCDTISALPEQRGDGRRLKSKAEQADNDQ